MLSWVAIIADYIETRVSTVFFTILEIKGFLFEALTGEHTSVGPGGARR